MKTNVEMRRLRNSLTRIKIGASTKRKVIKEKGTVKALIREEHGECRDANHSQIFLFEYNKWNVQ